jgi:hypothetical protein
MAILGIWLLVGAAMLAICSRHHVKLAWALCIGGILCLAISVTNFMLMPY